MEVVEVDGSRVLDFGITRPGLWKYDTTAGKMLSLGSHFQ